MTSMRLFRLVGGAVIGAVFVQAFRVRMDVLAAAAFLVFTIPFMIWTLTQD